MGDLVAINDQVPVEPAENVRQYSPCFAEDRSAPFLMIGKDEAGKRCWFIRVRTTGLYERRFGPFERRSDAIRIYDVFLEHAGRAMTEAFNHLSGNARELIQSPARLRLKAVKP